MGFFRRSEPFSAAVAKVIEASQVSEIDPTLPKRVVAYIQSGDGEAAALKAVAAAQPNWWESAWSGPERERRQELYALLDAAGPERGLRWARVVAEFDHYPYMRLAPIADGDVIEWLIDDIGRSFHHAAISNREAVPVRFGTIEDIVTEAGGRPGELLEALFRSGRHDFTGEGGPRGVMRSLPGYRERVIEDGSVLAGLAVAAPGALRPIIIDNLRPLDARGLAPFGSTLALYLVDGSATIATDTERLARRCLGTSVALRELAGNAKRGRQLRALDALWRLAPTPVDRPWARERAEALGTAEAADLIASWDSAPIVEARALVKPRPVRVDWTFPLTPEIDAALVRLVTRIDKEYSRYRRDGKVGLADGLLRRLRADARDPQPPRPADTDADIRFSYHYEDAIMAYAAIPGVTASNLVTVLMRTGDLFTYRNEMLRPLAGEAISLLRQQSGEPSLTLLAALLDGLDTNGSAMVAGGLLNSVGFIESASDDEIGPYVLEWVDRFVSIAEEGNRGFDDRMGAFEVLKRLRPLPDRAADAMYRMALGPRGHRRRAAQEVVRDDPRRSSRIVAALRDSSADTRMIAARWLAEIGTEAEIDLLDERYRAEKTERVRDALLTALAALGRSPDHYLNREALEKLVAKGKAAPPAWLDWDQAPPVRWVESGDSVDLDVLRWLVATAVKAKSPEPSVSLRYYVGLFDPHDAERFGDWLLNAWCAEENGIAAKGLLAICAVACKGNAAPVAEHYIRTYYGWRAAQCKALVAMLGWVDDAPAVQLLLAISTRFRTPGIKKEAGERVAELAERKGWSPAELADRTVPDAGFVDGELTLDFGPRQFHAHLTPSGTIALFDGDRKALKSLPAPRVSDDEELAAAAKKELSAARKTVKTVVKQATDRLYEAWCAEREWSPDDWERYLRSHPIVGILAQRLIWQSDDGRVFRPLGDGTLTDAFDEEVSLPSGMISLAGTGLVDDEEVGRWRAHFDDYRVDPLFEQFPHAYVPGDPQAKSVDDFVGYLLGMFSLRSAATKRGYEKGETGDGGFFFDYERRYPTLGVTASLHFSGVAQPVEDVTVALGKITFSGPRGALPLAQVPAGLVFATVADMRALAALGEYAQDWESQVTY
ncbi:DUF4132 domain-containing protein [Gordonia sp. X0973]|uniref:DUF4132 domain-containing protein n=1 Tax=Gordonia sp. X0973 TaxID=2742602 RepID=UPI000F52DC33|nr:DUF4132 domain-containing protein [Gordonia sp. X0973]QKT08697.1 DUF4132 domain-containing protein [Gordonia sp. X0973]